ncbi:MAG: Holliday junction resolvase RuvX [Candidatus Kaiserbacteria bacterium]|nr:Holliday junction resolvase RuvX [Candidatus Kaiserbacteria bacterium]
MKYLGIDYGAKRIGLALSDESGAIAFPRGTIENQDALAHIRGLIDSEKVGAIIMGDTKAPGGLENPISKEAAAFAEMLARETGLLIERVWEAWSSIEASRLAPKGQEHDDSAAAAIILQRYLDSRGKRVE